MLFQIEWFCFLTKYSRTTGSTKYYASRRTATNMSIVISAKLDKASESHRDCNMHPRALCVAFVSSGMCSSIWHTNHTMRVLSSLLKLLRNIEFRWLSAFLSIINKWISENVSINLNTEKTSHFKLFIGFCADVIDYICVSRRVFMHKKA